ncbi:siroheme synthase [Devosia elaeis]|uniref:siroheme synthase family protein n=1 Tax=Devosia elaeis TaxID=1770058 RepID=UPI0009EEABBB|nr:SAM-dependent methyltransferase [Devosia elaeis]
MRTVSPQPNSPRIAPLAVLPVFFDLRGKRVVVIGGSEAAAWKTELLAAAGAHVDVYAEEICAELAALAPPSPLRGGNEGGGAGAPTHIEFLGSRRTSTPNPSPQGGGEPGITLHLRPWSAEDLSNTALAIADLESDAEARAFIAAARAASVPYNVIDQPEFCQFQFGAIVNRSPLVVGISTAGAAPILGQAVRRRIETLLPRSLALWAQLAARLRDRVMENLAPGPQRRVFWERLADKAFGEAPPVRADEEISPVTAMPLGRISLVGAGPGAPDLLTVKAVRALQSADIILFDARVPAAILELARREARRLPVADDAVAQMVALARQGKHVVRLRTGDALSDTGGEMITRLEDAGIAVNMVPGLPAARQRSDRTWPRRQPLTSSRTSASSPSRPARSAHWSP